MGTTIIGLVITLICALPIILWSLNNYKKKKKKLEILKGLAKDHNCKVGQFDLTNKILIATDKSLQKIFHIKWLDEKASIQVVDMNGVKSCEVNNLSKKSSNKKYNSGAIEKIELIVKHQDVKKNDIALEFYNIEYDGINLGDELLLAEKWCNIINRKVESLSKQKTES